MDGKIAPTTGFARSIAPEVLIDITAFDFSLDYLSPEPATRSVRRPDEMDDRHHDDTRDHDEQKNGQKECDQYYQRSKDGCEEFAEPCLRLYRNLDDSHRAWPGRLRSLPMGKLVHHTDIDSSVSHPTKGEG